MFLPILSAILGILAFSPWGFWISAFIFLAPLFIFFLLEKSFWRLILGTVIFRLILMLGTIFFTFDPFIFLLSVFVFLGLPISVYILKRATKKAIVILIFLPVFLAFFEHLQAKYSFLPLYSLTSGNILASSPFLGLAGIGGLPLLTLFAALINVLLVITILNINSRPLVPSLETPQEPGEQDFKQKNKTKDQVSPFADKIKQPRFLKTRLLAAIAIVLIIVTAWQFSSSRLRENLVDYQGLKNRLSVAIISNDEKFDEKFLVFKNDVFTDKEKESAKIMIDEALRPIKSDLTGKKLDLLVLPEDMIDIEIWNDADKNAEEEFGISNAGVLIEAYQSLAKELKTNTAATMTTYQNSKRHNTTLLFNRDGEIADIYNKSHLTIASENWPFGNWRPFYYNWLQKIMPAIGTDNALFDKMYQYRPGKRKILQVDSLAFAAPICVEIHYPNEMKEFKNLGAKFISHTSSNRWIKYGLKKYLYLTNNLRKIESVWLKIPILMNGRYEKAGIVTPDGKMNLVDFESENKNYGLFIGEIAY